MFPHQCLFCDHVNPVGAKFCNDCGSPLHLKPCKQCEAINDHAAQNCYRCGAADPALVIAAPELLSLTSETTAATATPDDVSFDRGASVEPLTQDVATLLRRHADAAATNLEPGVQTATHEPRALTDGMSASAPKTLRATPADPAEELRAVAGPGPVWRVTSAEILPALLLVVVALSAFHVYRNPLQLRGWLDSAKVAIGSADGRPMQSIPETIAVPAPPALADLGTGSVAGVASDGPASTNTRSIAVTHAPVPAEGPTGIDLQTTTSNQSPSVTSALPPPLDAPSDRVMPARLAGPDEDNAGTPGTTTTNAVEPRAKTTLAAGKQGNSKKTSTIGKATPKKAKKTSTKNPASTKPAPAPKTTTEPAKTARRE
jgi:hypothetical protein